MKYNALNNIQIKNAKPKEKMYRLVDGGNLNLEIHPSGAKYWRMGFSFNNKRKAISFGSYPMISLSEARELAQEAKKLVIKGIDPVHERQQVKLQKQLEYENNFETIAKEWHENKKHSWLPKHGANILRRLDVYVFPILGKKPITDITPRELLHAIRNIEKEGKNEMAHRVLQTCGQVFRFAIACGKAERDITQDLKGALAPAITKGFANLKEPELPDFLRKLNLYDTHYNGNQITKWGMQLIILTFVRNSELRQAQWCEIDFEKKQWRIPAERMKMKGIHVVPLSEQSLCLFKNIHKLTGDCYSGYIFPSFQNPRKTISDGTFSKLLDKIGYKNKTTVHGFRKTASTILHEEQFDSIWIERQLAHCDRNQIRATYNYAQHLPERARMMQWWADYVEQKGMKIDNNK